MAVVSSSARLPANGVDPVTHGEFIIEWAYVIDYAAMKVMFENVMMSQASVSIWEHENPLYTIIKEQPIRLQKFIGSVDFGTEKRFIRFTTIENYEVDEKDNVIRFHVVFEFLGNLQYLEGIEDYKNHHIL
jgi:hypothetical protein